MSDLIAITFDGADDAAAALHSVRSLEHEGRFKLEDTAVVTKDAEGKVHVKNEMSSGTETGAVVGAVLGGLLFVVFPVAIVGGAIVGGLIGRAVAPGHRWQLRQAGRGRPAGRWLGACSCCPRVATPGCSSRPCASTRAGSSRPRSTRRRKPPCATRSSRPGGRAATIALP